MVCFVSCPIPIRANGYVDYYRLHSELGIEPGCDNVGFHEGSVTGDPRFNLYFPPFAPELMGQQLANLIVTPTSRAVCTRTLLQDVV